MSLYPAERRKSEHLCSEVRDENFLRLTAAILIGVGAWALGMIIVRFFPDIAGTNTERLVGGIIGGIAECVALFLLFRRKFCAEKTEGIAMPTVCFFLALVINGLLSWLIHFYPYVSGAFATNIGRYFYDRKTGIFDTVLPLSEIPALYFVIPLAVTDVLLIGMFILAFYSAKKIKEKDKITH